MPRAATYPAAVDSEGRRRACVLLGWLFAAAAGVLMITQTFGWNGFKLVATAQALTPYVLLGLIPLAGIACWAHADRLAVTSSLIGVGGLILASPLVFTPDRPDPDTTAMGTSIAAVNLLYSNPIVDEAADELLARDADVILFSEYTAEHQAVMLDHPLSARYPFKIERDGLYAGGMALWSRHPVVEGERPDTINYTLDITMTSPDGPLRLFGVHPPTPILLFEGWVDDLGTFGELGAAANTPTLLIGDFNASYWHPAFRDLLSRGFVSAHSAQGSGFSTSWPTNKVLPAFVRLDHALTGNGLVSTGVDDFTVPGSDHRGFVVTVVPAR
jgi:endonuclease/exonuclease/phosphatase (EEP) superfamily protein YafD